ncbi:hypothetical protein Nham_3104 [Nitrobacter hamburgensis X14]|uniref:Uncharacterized protein n=1 Tax=Nitrobacter hamburgensis (strain DSM 10229 / NCIMB 13809 / X14) TaxID=323097 RepID=Q1QIV6_NITHX|nr:hypothetical protein Nham_3104 [Nitrobacter hamburgensis X14]
MSFESDAIDRSVESEGRSHAAHPPFSHSPPIAPPATAGRTSESEIIHLGKSDSIMSDYAGLAASESGAQDSHDANPNPFCSRREPHRHLISCGRRALCLWTDSGRRCADSANHIT